MLIIFYTSLVGLLWAVSSTGKEENSDLPQLFIEQVSSREYGLIVVKRVQETLNLTCYVFDNSTDSIQRMYNISWTIPWSSYNSKNRVAIQSSLNSANLVISHLESRDEGEYRCTAKSLNINGSQHILTKVVSVNIKDRKKGCTEAQFSCTASKLCIPLRYKCDGHQDCHFGEDEDLGICGDPCLEKLTCEYNSGNSTVKRCIPKSWCCNFKLDINCTTREPLSCCPVTSYSEEKEYYVTHQPQYGDVTFLQTTIYTVIGCSIAFMVVVTILVITICRVHMKRSLIATQCPPVPQPIQNSSPYDLDIYLNQGCMLESINTPGIFVAYNANNGVHIVGRAVDPPPYSEVVCLPPKEGPPPPYRSREALDQPETEALLQQPNISQGPKAKQSEGNCGEETLHPSSEWPSDETNIQDN